MKRSVLMKIWVSCLLAVALLYSEGCRKGGTTAAAVPPGAPTVTTQPVAAQTVTAGASATFTVVATGTGNTYQWRKGGVNIGGATSATYTIATTVAGDAGSYDVVITNPSGTVTSTASVLTVNPAGSPAITTQPANQSVTAPATATFTVVATGNPTLTYQWYRGAGTGSPVGTNSASYTTAATTVGADNGAQFHVVVTNGVGSIDSALATLTVTAPTAATITTQPVSTTVAEPATATFTVVAGGGGPYTYQWYRGAGTGTPVGTNSASYTTAATTKVADNGAQFHVVVTNAGGSIDSNLVTLTVTAPYTGNPIELSTAAVTLPTAASPSAVKVSSMVTLTNTSGLPVTVALTGGAAWLSGSPSPITIPGGGTADIAVTGDPAVGSGTANLTLTNTPGGQNQTIAVTFSATGASTATAGVASANVDAAFGGLVTLDGSSTTGATTYQWTQIGGPAVTLTGATTNTATFTAPSYVPARSLKFQLEAKPLTGASSFAIVNVGVYHSLVNKARLYVDPVAGNDANTASSNANTKSTPMKTLALAYLDANSTGTATSIYMAAGADTFSGTINLRHNISIYGGFEATNWTRDVVANVTTVTNTEDVSGVASSTAMDTAGQPLDSTDHIDGFTLVGGKGEWAYCLNIASNASPTVENMTFVGGEAVNGDSECIRNRSIGNPLIKNCTFTLGTTSTGTGGRVLGVYLIENAANPPLATINGCTFGGGTSVANLAYIYTNSSNATGTAITNCNFLGTGTSGIDFDAIYSRGAKVNISKSIIKAGGSPTVSRGVYLDFRFATTSFSNAIDACHINGGSGVGGAIGVNVRYQAASMTAQPGTAATITNCYILGGSSAGSNVGVELSDNGTSGATNPLRVTLNNNTINSGTASDNCTGVALNGTSTPGTSLTANNNIFFTSQTGGTAGVTFTKLISESTAPGINTPAVLNNNLFFIDTAFTGVRDYYYIKNTPTNLETADTDLTLTDPTSINGFLTATTKAGNINLTTAQGIANATVFAFPGASPFDPHLKAGCPAIDAGNNAAAPATDIDGDARPNGSTVDIGADEN